MFIIETMKLFIFAGYFLLIVISGYLLLNEVFTVKNKLTSELELESICECKNKIKIMELNASSYSINIAPKERLYVLNKNEFKTSIFQCDLYNVFKRGKNQKVISYSLFGRNERYYNLIGELSKLIKQMYPEWIIRIYHDYSIDMKIVCRIECQSDNIDFCNINRLPISNSFNSTWNASFIYPSIWRFLSVGDSFVNVFMSRDLDSLVYQRELDSVNVWLNRTIKSGHIMRDHPWHRSFILGGLWGFYSARNKTTARRIYSLIVNKTLAKFYKQPGEKWSDQNFLNDHVYSLIKNDSVIHDSYLCSFFKDSEPFPSQRLLEKFT